MDDQYTRIGSVYQMRLDSFESYQLKCIDNFSYNNQMKLQSVNHIRIYSNTRVFAKHKPSLNIIKIFNKFD